jgi:hypothetical protein
MAQERANALKDQFIMDMHTHFLRDDTRIQTFVRQREAVGKAGWNPALIDKPQTIEDSEVEQLLQGGLPRQRHQDRADLERALGRAPGLVPHQRDDDRRTRARQQGGGLQAHDGALPSSPGSAGLARELEHA